MSTVHAPTPATALTTAPLKGPRTLDPREQTTSNLWVCSSMWVTERHNPPQHISKIGYLPRRSHECPIHISGCQSRQARAKVREHSNLYCSTPPLCKLPVPTLTSPGSHVCMRGYQGHDSFKGTCGLAVLKGRHSARGVPRSRVQSPGA